MLKNCAVCGKEFLPNAPNQKCCSAECSKIRYRKYDIERKRRKRAQGPKQEKICPVCGKKFKGDTHHRKYCSPECYAEFRRKCKRVELTLLKKTCPVCQKTFETLIKRQKYCSLECLQRFQKMCKLGFPYQERAEKKMRAEKPFKMTTRQETQRARLKEKLLQRRKEAELNA